MAERQSTPHNEPSALTRVIHRSAFNSFEDGIKLYEAKRYEEALVAINKGLLKYAKYSPAFYNKGIILTRLGRNEEALSAYDQAIRLDSTDTKSYVGKASVLNKLERYNEAITAATQAHRLDANNVSARYAKGDAFFELGKYQDAINEYNSFLSGLYFDKTLENKNELQNATNRRIALAWMKLGQYVKVVDACDSAIASDASDFRSYVIKGEALQHLNEHEQAIRAYDHALPLIRQQPMYIRFTLESNAEYGKKQAQGVLEENKRKEQERRRKQALAEEENRRQDEEQKRLAREKEEKISGQIQTQTQEIMKTLGARDELEQLNRRLYGERGKVIDVHKEISHYIPPLRLHGGATTVPGSITDYLVSGIALVGTDSNKGLSSLIFVGTRGKTVKERDEKDLTMGKIYVDTFVIKDGDWWNQDHIDYSLSSASHHGENEIMDYTVSTTSGAHTEPNSSKSFGTKNYFLPNVFESRFSNYTNSKERKVLHDRLDKITNESLMKLYENESALSSNTSSNSSSPDSAQGFAQAEEAARMRRGAWDQSGRSGLGHPGNIPDPYGRPTPFGPWEPSNRPGQIGPDGKPIPPRKPPGNAFG